MSEENNEMEVNAEEKNKTRTAKRVKNIHKDAALSLLVDTNPKRGGGASYERFEGYFKDEVDTVQKALDAGLTMGDIKYDIAHEFIQVEGAEVEEYEVASRGPRGSSKSKADDNGNLLEAGGSASTEGLLDEEDDNAFG